MFAYDVENLDNKVRRLSFPALHTARQGFSFEAVPVRELISTGLVYLHKPGHMRWRCSDLGDPVNRREFVKSYLRLSFMKRTF